jgi:YHS domain-containing protein
MARLAVYAGLGLLLVVLLLAWWRTAQPRGKATRGQVTGDRMVRDPVCGIYVPRARALARVVDGVEHRFCSRECAEAFVTKTTARGNQQG